MDQRPVPDFLWPYTGILEPANDPKVREWQADWMRKNDRIWSETAEVETALGLCGRSDDRDRIERAAFDIDLAEVIFHACHGLSDRTVAKQIEDTAWLLLKNGSRVKPGDVLVLSTAIEEAARAVLPSAKREFPCQEDIAPALLRSPAWEKASQRCGFPDQETSRGFLLDMVRETPGSLGDGTPEDHAALAKAEFEDGTKEWALMSALLKEHAPDKIIEAFKPIEDDANVRARLQALGNFARQKQSDESACARRIYDAAFVAAVEGSSSSARRRERLTDIQVMTAAGQWQPSSDVSENAEVEKRHRLAEPLDAALKKALRVERDDTPMPTIGTISPQSAEGREHLLAVLKPLQRLDPAGARLCYALFDREQNAVQAWGKEFGQEDIAELERSIERLNTTLRGKQFDRTLLAIPLEDAGQSVSCTTLDGGTKILPVSENIGVFVSARPKETGASDWLVSLIIPKPKNAREATELLAVLASRIVLDAHGWVNVWREPTEGSCEPTLPVLFRRAATGEDGAIARLRALMKDQLPGLLKGFKSSDIPSLKDPLNKWRDGDSALEASKSELWKVAKQDSARAELREAVRNRILGFGYGPERTLLELFQNAHDAYADLNTDGAVRVEYDGSVLQFLHWGRCVSVPAAGSDEDTGRRQRADLENMLMPGWSDKGDDNVGTFGLGFKCVHLLSDTPGIVSGTESCRIQGGFIPEYWSEGLDLTREYDDSDRYATLLHLPLRDDAFEGMTKALEKLNVAAEGLLVLSGHVTRLEMPDGTWRVESRKELVEAVQLVCISAPNGQQDFLVLILGAARLLLRLKGGVPDSEWTPKPNLWRLAPLGESIDAHWMLDPALPVDAGRTGLQGEDQKQQESISYFAAPLRERLMGLHAAGLDGLRPEGEQDDAFASAFWAGMREVLASDYETSGLRSALHKGAGWAGAARKSAILPNDLDDSLVATQPQLTRLDRKLKDRVEYLRRLPGWAEKRLVITDVKTNAAEALGLGECLSASLIAMHQIKRSHLLSPTTAAALGGIVDLIDSQGELRDLADDARFDAQTGGALSVSILTRNENVPPQQRLSDRYCEDGCKFFDALKKVVQDGPSDTPPRGNEPKKNPKKALASIYDWWVKNRVSQIGFYETKVYPDGHADLIRRISATRDPAWQSDAEKAEQNTRDWFTLLALGCFRTVPWNKDTTNRRFLDHKSVSSHWAEIARYDPNKEFGPWQTMLHDWYRDDIAEIDLHTWRRTFGDLYTLRRYLSEYQRLFAELPKLKRQDRDLRDALTPAKTDTDIKAPPLQSLIRNGAPWIIRELCRNAGEERFYSREEAATLAPWCWSPRSGLIRFLNDRVGLSLNSKASSEDIHQAVRASFVGNAERVSFDGDHDLPFDILSRDSKLAVDAIGKEAADKGAGSASFSSFSEEI